MTEADTMELDELQSVRDRERQTDKLQQLRTSFYAEAGEFIQDLRERRESAADRADEPFDAPEVSRLSDEIDTAEQTIEAIYEKRVGKIVKAASFAAADLPTEVEGMTAEEKELFDSMVGNIRENRQHVLDVLSGEAGEGDTPEGTIADETDRSDHDESSSEGGAKSPRTPRISEGEEALSDAEVDPADLMGTSDGASADEFTEDPADNEDAVGEDEPTSEEDDNASDEDQAGTDESGPPVRNDGGPGTPPRETVRITDDVGAILGVDQREYELSRNDVVTLPSANAEPLVEQDAATRLD